jgi:hypothetical protein
LVPNEKNSASFATSSAVRAALGISIIVPTRYFKLTPASLITASAVSTTTALTYCNSLTSLINGIIISGTTLPPLALTAIAALITARVCIAAISG